MTLTEVEDLFKNAILELLVEGNTEFYNVKIFGAEFGKFKQGDEWVEELRVLFILNNDQDYEGPFRKVLTKLEEWDTKIPWQHVTLVSLAKGPGNA